MKNILKNLSITFLVCFLGGSFYSANLYFPEWDASVRGAVLGSFACIGMFVAVGTKLNDQL